MPIYEYSCDQCSHEFEHLVRTQTEARPSCPSCGSDRIRKAFSTFSASVKQGPSGDSCSMGACPSGQCAQSGCPFERS